MSLSRFAIAAAFCLSVSLLSEFAFCQSEPPAKSTDATVAEGAKSAEEKVGDTKAIVIPDEPKAIAPSQFVFEPLRKKVTVSFDGTSIREVIEWIKNELKVTVLVDESEFAKGRILLSDPVSDRLKEQPAYLLLDRLSSIGVGWYVEEDILFLTSKSYENQHVMPTTINVGEFFDSEYSATVLIDLLHNMVDPQSWLDTNGGPGTLVLLGDVLFMQQTEQATKVVQGLLAGLKKHGRQTFVGDAIEHILLREKLENRVSVSFDDKPLVDAIDQISRLGGIEIRINRADFKAEGIRDREPLSLSLSNQKLSTILSAVASKFNIDWTLESGTVLLCSKETESERVKIAIYDVRDLCRNVQESNALVDAIMTQIDSESWLDTNGGPGTAIFPKSGLLVVAQTERIHGILLRQLEAYRKALKNSKFREQKDPGKESANRFLQNANSNRDANAIGTEGIGCSRKLEK